MASQESGAGSGDMGPSWRKQNSMAEIPCLSRPDSAPPECRRQHHQQGENFQAAEQHRKRADPGLEIAQHGKGGGGPHIAQPGAGVVDARHDGSEGGDDIEARKTRVKVRLTMLTMYMKPKASTANRTLWGATCPPMRTLYTALGCMARMISR